MSRGAPNGNVTPLYGSTTYKPRDFSENSYLQKILNYAEVAYPTLKFNSAMINKYDFGLWQIPHTLS